MFNKLYQMIKVIKMDYVKLYQYYQSSKLTDLEITLNDGINTLQLKVHKLILSLSAPFFEKQFAFSTEDKIILNVDNAFVTYDLIMSFYGQKMNHGNLENWFHTLKTFQLRDYFGLDNDVGLLSTLQVPTIGFDLFLEVCELIGFNEDITKIINKNLPDDYDCFKLSKDLLNEMIESASYYKIFSGESDNSIKIRNMQTGDLINDLNGHTNTVKSVNISSDDKLIVSGSYDNNIIIWNANTGELMHKLIDHDSVLSVSFSPNNELIVSVSCDNTIKIWNVQTGELIGRLIGHNDDINSVCFSPDNQFIVSGSEDHTIKIWNSKNYKLINTLMGHTDGVWSIAVSSDSKRIVSGSRDSTIKIWDIENGQLIHSFIARDFATHYVHFSSNNNKIISCSSNQTIKIWDANNYHLIHTLGQTDHPKMIIFSSNDKFIVSKSSQSIKIWDANNYQLINTINLINENRTIIMCVAISNACDTTLSKKLKTGLL